MIGIDMRRIYLVAFYHHNLLEAEISVGKLVAQVGFHLGGVTHTGESQDTQKRGNADCPYHIHNLLDEYCKYNSRNKAGTFELAALHLNVLF